MTKWWQNISFLSKLTLNVKVPRFVQVKICGREKIRSRGQSRERTPSRCPSKTTTLVLFENVITAGEAQGGRDRNGRVETQLKCSLKRRLWDSVPVQFAVLYYWRPATLGGFYHRTLAAKTPTSVWCCKKAFSITDILSPHHSLSHPFPPWDGPLIFFLHKCVKPH